jgi:hypothetical protein
MKIKVTDLFKLKLQAEAMHTALQNAITHYSYFEDRVELAERRVYTSMLMFGSALEQMKKLAEHNTITEDDYAKLLMRDKK